MSKQERSSYDFHRLTLLTVELIRLWLWTIEAGVTSQKNTTCDDVVHLHCAWRNVALAPWASYQICNIACCACAGNAGNGFPATAGWRSRHASRHVRDARAVMHVGIANLRFPLKSVAGKTFPAFPAHAQLALLRIWQEAHCAHHTHNWVHEGLHVLLAVFWVTVNKTQSTLVWQVVVVDGQRTIGPVVNKLKCATWTTLLWG